MIRLASALVLFALALAPARVLADAKSEARARMERATELHGQGKFAEALVELMTSYSLDPRPEVLYAIAQTHVQLGNCPQAITFYERFLSTHPAAVPAAAAEEAIETCKTGPSEPAAPAGPDPAPVPGGPAAGPAPAPSPAPGPAPAPPLAPPTVDRDAGPAPWYTDVLGDALIGGGVVCSAIAVLSYRAALGELDDADAASDYQRHADLVDSARGKRTLATAFAVGGAGLIGAGVVRFVLRGRHAERSGVAIAPARGGAVLGWSGRF